MSAAVCNLPCSLTERMLTSTEDRRLRDMLELQLMALFTKDLCMQQLVVSHLGPAASQPGSLQPRPVMLRSSLLGMGCTVVLSSAVHCMPS